MQRLLRHYVLVMVLLVVGTLSISAQNRQITGYVSDATGEPIIGASILIKGTSTGTITDLDGNFHMANVAPTGALVISYIGYTQEEIPLSPKNHYQIILNENTEQLEEVIVVGYGVQRKSDLTGAVASVKASEALSNTPSGNITEALQGRLAGVSIAGDGNPSSSAAIRIRGVNSINADSSPLVVVDGFIGGSLKSLNPADIESIEVLKDASATAVYGSRGANGVILVTTKSPQKDKMSVSVNAFVNLKTIQDSPDVLSAGEYAELANAYGKEFYESQNMPAQVYYTEQEIDDFYAGKKGFNYMDAIFNSPAVNQNYELSIANGGEKTNFLASFRYEGAEGVIKNSRNDAFNYRLKVDTQLKKWWKLGLNFWGDYNESSGPRMAQYEGLLLGAINYAPTVEPYDEEGNYNHLFPVSGNVGYNPMGHINEIDAKTQELTNRMQGYVHFDLAEGLTFRSQLGVTFINRLTTKSENEKSYEYFKNSQTKAQAGSSMNFGWLNTNTLNYTKEFNANHRINATAVFEQSYSNTYAHNSYALDLTFPQLGSDALSYSNKQTANSTRTINTLLSGLVRLNYVFKNRYMFTASWRADGSSRLENKWDFFPSAAVAWNVKEESFLRDVTVVSQLKLRAGYGSVGNQAVEPYRIYSQMSPVNNPDGTVSYIVGRPAAYDLGWERNDQVNLGVDLGFFNNRLSLNFDWYDKLSKDVLLDIQQPVHTGWGSLLKNACEIRNRGVELTLSGDPIVGRDFSWHTDVTFSHNKGTYEKIPTLSKMQSFAGKYEKQLFKMIEGEKLGSFWGYTSMGVWKTDEVNQQVTITKPNGQEQSGTYAEIYKVVPGQEKFLDVNKDGVYNDKDMSIIGNGQPLFNWGWNNTFTYKNFDLSLFVVGFHGFDIYNVTDQSGYKGTVNGANYDNVTPKRDLLNRWTPENENTNIPGFVKEKKPLSGFHSRFVEKGDFIKVKSITLRYNLPNALCKKIALQDLQFYASVQNPFTITKYKGLDPEAALGNPLTSGADWGAYPNGRNYLVGVNFSF